MRPATIVILLVAVAASAWLLLQRVSRTGGLLGLSVQQRADLMTPLAYAMMAPANDDNPFARMERGRDGKPRLGWTQSGSSVPWAYSARVLSVWGDAKFSAPGDRQAWGIAVGRAREEVIAERSFSIGRFLEAVGAGVSGLVTFGGATIAWGIKLGAETDANNAARAATARAAIERMEASYEAWVLEIMRVARCPAFTAPDGEARELRGGGYGGTYPDYPRECASILRTIRPFAF